MRVTTESPLTVLAGIGPKKAAMFEKIGIVTVGDLLRHFPRAYQNRGDIKTLAEAGFSQEPCALLLTVGSQPNSVRLPNRMVMTKFTAFDETGRCDVVFFNQNYIKDAFALGATYRFWGRLTLQRHRWQIASPQFEPYDGIHPLPDFTPVYPLGGGISQKLMRSTVGLALACLEGAPDPLPADLRKRNHLGSFTEALYALHCPMSLAGLALARRYFVFEELLLLSLSSVLAGQAAKNRPGIPLAAGEEIQKEFLDKLPFALTGAQRRVMGEISADLSSGYAMHRLLSGDVGSGKTVCAAFAAWIAVKNGYQAALMAPTEILARQHYGDLSPLFASLGISTALLVGSMTPSAKRKVHGDAASGRVSLVIGTHALLTDAMVFASPALMITDEQHRFGVRQRALLAEKGQGLHVLVMSATPIPRTLALVMYGDLELSAVDEMPPGRQKVSTFLVDESYRVRLNGFIARQAAEGHQVYVVCPAIEEWTEEGDDTGGALVDLRGQTVEKKKLRSAVAVARELAGALPGVRVGCLHGKMNDSEKDGIMGAFASGEIQVLVSTTVIEVGVNVPNATLMVIENAERFGLSQLHQLRGRVGRGKAKSYCILMSDATGDEAVGRMKELCATGDGYRIAEYDLNRRGPGDFLAGSEGARQHGEGKFRMAALCDDPALFAAATREAKELAAEDPALSREEHRVLRLAMDRLVKEHDSGRS